jgi:hypothetical protein
MSQHLLNKIEDSGAKKTDLDIPKDTEHFLQALAKIFADQLEEEKQLNYEGKAHDPPDKKKATPNLH